MDAGTQREETEALVQQADTAVQSARQAADHEARTAKATGRMLGEVKYVSLRSFPPAGIILCLGIVPKS